MSGTVKYRPGPTTRASLPKRSTTTFSQESAMCVEDSTSSAVSNAAAMAARPMPPVAIRATPSTTAQVTTNTAMLKMTAPLREDLRGTYEVAALISASLSVSS